MSRNDSPAKQRRYNSESQAEISPTPRADESLEVIESPQIFRLTYVEKMCSQLRFCSKTQQDSLAQGDSQEISQEMQRSIPPGAAPGSNRKRDSRRDSRRDSEPLVRETVPPQLHSSPENQFSEPDSGGKSEFRKKLQEDHLKKMRQKQAEIERLEDDKDRMTEELRKLKHASAVSTAVGFLVIFRPCVTDCLCLHCRALSDWKMKANGRTASLRMRSVT